MTGRPHRLSVRDEGLALVELVIVSAFSLVLVFAVLSLLDSGTKAERGTEARHSAILKIREAVVRMDKDLRQATAVDPSSTATSLNMCTYVSGAPRRVQYTIAAGTLSRRLSASPTATCSLSDALGTTGTPLVTRVRVPSDPAANFCYNPGYDPSATPHWTCDTSVPANQVRITIVSTPEVLSGGPITAGTNVDLRNVFH